MAAEVARDRRACPVCGQLVGVRQAPSGAIRIARHDRMRTTGLASCAGTGREVAAR